MPISEILALLITIGPQQYGSVNLLSAPPRIASLGATSVAPSTCEVQVTIFRPNGNQVTGKTFNLALGQSAELTFGSAGGTYTQQATLLNNCPASSTTCDVSLCNVTDTVETINSITGDTQVLTEGFVSAPAMAL